MKLIQLCRLDAKVSDKLFHNCESIKIKLGKVKQTGTATKNDANMTGDRVLRLQNRRKPEWT